MSYIGPIQYDSHLEPSAAVKLVIVLAAMLFIALMLMTATLAVKLEPDHRGELASMAP